MGDFFTSPRERAAEDLYGQGRDLYSMALSGHPVGEALIRQLGGRAKTGVEALGSRQIAEASTDILSQLASMGVAPGTAGADLTAKTAGKIRGGVQEQFAKIDEATQATILDALFKTLGLSTDMTKTGMSGMSSSSTFGDILAGLTTGTGLGAGIAALGGPQGMGWWGSLIPEPQFPDPVNPNWKPLELKS